jgi:uncharacterized protein YecE (DUF72 family)
MSAWVGTSGFQYPEWKGSFYPEDLPVKKMLPYYAGQFSTTEINYSFRRIPSKSTLASWAAATPAGFKFAFKAPQRITHFARLKDCEETLRFFATAVSDLGGKLGPILFQLPPKFIKNIERLQLFLRAIPRPVMAAFEFRDPSWFDDEVFSTLKEHDAALCIAETEEISTPQIATAHFGYLRLRREDFREPDIRRWAKYVDSQTQWRDAFIYFKHEETGSGPKFAASMLRALGN